MGSPTDWRELAGDSIVAMRVLPFGFEGVLVPAVTWGGTRFHAVVRLNHAEIERRRDAALGHVLDFQLLQAISTLPVGEPIKWEDIDPVVAAVLDCAPAGVVDATTSTATVRLAPPLEMVGMYVVCRHWRALGRLGVFARVGLAGVVVKHWPRAVDDAIAMARRGGLGLAVQEDQGPRVLVEPRSDTALTVGRRRILEAVYGQWARQTTRISAN